MFFFLLNLNQQIIQDTDNCIHGKYFLYTMTDSDFLNELFTSFTLDGNSDTILDFLPVGIEIYATDGRLLYMSKPDARIFGADRIETMEAEINIFDNPNFPLDMKEALCNCMEIHKRIPYDFNLIDEVKYYSSKKREKIYIECNGRPIRRPDGNVESYVFIIEDVTKEVFKEQELYQSKRKMELAIRDSGIMLWEFDVLRKVFYSDNEPLNAYNRSKPISIELYTNTVHPDDREALNKIMERMVSGDNFNYFLDVRVLFPNNPEWQYCTVNGSPYEYDAEGRVIRYVGTRKNNTDLQKKELLQDKILNSIPLPIHIKDIEDNFRYVFCNDESKRMFGTSEVKTTYDVMEAENVARIEKTDKEVFATGNPYLGLERIILKDGRSYDTIVRKSVIYDNGKRLLLNVRWDQSLQNELERRAKLLSISMEAMDAYSWFFIPGENSVSFGEGFERKGRDISRLNTLEKFVEAIHPEDQHLFVNTINQTIEGQNDRWDVEYRVDLNNSGVYEWWQTRGLLETTLRDDISYTYMYGMSININAHKQTELTLRRNKEELDNLLRQNELVLNNTNSGLAYITTDYIVQWENVSICSKSLSYEAYRKGDYCYRSAHGRTTPCEDCVLQRAMKSRQLEQIKFTLKDKHIVEVFATPVFKDSNVEGIVIRVDDITEREHMIEELRDARIKAEESDKLKSAFLANMSHEIRTPLNAIVGFSELLINSPEIENKEEYMRIISDNNELLLKLINDILDLSKIEAGTVELKYEDFDLSEYFNALATSMKQRVTNVNVRLLAENHYAECYVRLDKNRVAQILTNYVTNAIKYTPKGFIEMGYESKDDGIRFYVRDSGIGIPEEKKSKVFYRFEKLDEFAQGTGLGLSICKAIAESMQGQVGFESRYGEGSLFWAFLPCKPQVRQGKILSGLDIDEYKKTSPTPMKGEVRVIGTVGKKKSRVLIVEDISSNYLLVSSLLKDKYELMHAKNGLEAIKMVEEYNPDLVLMDMKMPVMDGMKATEEIRRFNKQVPVVALTAHAFDTDRQAALAVGCNDYLVKPVNKKQLLDILRKYCG